MTEHAALAQDDFEYLLQYAEDDWVGLSVLVAESGYVLGEKASDEQILEVVLSTISDLMNYGAVPGYLTKGIPGFTAWQGSKSDCLSRIREEVHQLGRLPYTGEVCWIHVPQQSAD